MATNHSIHVGSMAMRNKPSSCSSPSSSNLKTLMQTCSFIFPRLFHMKSGLLKLLRRFSKIMMKKHRKQQKKRVFVDSFRVHYNWCSSHGLISLNSHVYYDASWNSVIPMMSDFVDQPEDEWYELSRYLEWLEENGNEMDKVAGMPISNC